MTVTKKKTSVKKAKKKVSKKTVSKKLPDHGMVGKRNALKHGEKMTKRLTCRCLESDRESWVEAANVAGVKYCEWVNQTLNDKADEVLG